MKFIFGMPQPFLMVVAPIVTTTAIATLPAQAATFSFSRSDVVISNFNQTIANTNTTTDSQSAALGFSPDAAVAAQADAVASVNIPANQFTNFAFGLASGTQGAYLGSGLGIASGSGSFLFANSGTFSFDFAAQMQLRTLADDPQSESAIATGDIVFRLVDNRTQAILDVFGLFGRSTALDGTTFSFQANGNVAAALSAELLTDRTARAVLQGTYSRNVNAGDEFVLEEYKVNRVAVQAVPTPSTVGGIVVMMAFLVKRIDRRSGRLLFQKKLTGEK